MAILKGESFSLTKPSSANVGLQNVFVGLGWITESGALFDIDLSCLLLTETGKVRSDKDFVFYNSSLKRPDGTIPSPCGSVIHAGDALSGSGTGDDEKIAVALNLVPPEIKRIAFYVSLYDHNGRGQRFGFGQSVCVRIVDAQTNLELKRYSLPEEFGVYSVMHFGDLVRKNKRWVFQASGEGFKGGMGGIVQQYGVRVQAESIAANY